MGVKITNCASPYGENYMDILSEYEDGSKEIVTYNKETNQIVRIKNIFINNMVEVENFDEEE